jgi:transglutaminase-like putative cysteine protease
VNLAVPERLPSQELLSDIRYSISPMEIAKDRWGQPCALFELGTVAAGKRRPLSYTVNARISAIRYLIDPAKTGTLDDIPDEIRSAYTVDGSRYRINTPYIQDTARKIVGDERNPYWIARKTFNFMIKSLEYEMVGGWDVPEVVLKRGSGSCSEYTFAFIALCRAAGLPARYQGSVVVRGDDASIDESFHRWAEVYLPNYGWVPVDANKGDAKSPADQARGFGELANRFLITTRSGGDSEYLDWSYNSFATYKTTGYCNVEDENFGFWEPLEATEMTPTTTDAKSPGECQVR